MTESAASCVAALRARYQGDGKEESHVLISEARSGAGHAGNDGRLDLVAVGCWQSVGLIVQGHEVKVSRSDWLRELKNPKKTERFMRYCHRFWLVVPAPWKDIVHDGELPESWGLLEVKNGMAKVVRGRTAPKLDPEPLPWHWQVGWLAQVDRVHGRRERSVNQGALSAEFRRGLEEGERRSVSDGQVKRLKRSLDHGQRQTDELKARLSVLAEIVGVADIGGSWIPRPGEVERIRAVLRIASNGGLGRAVDLVESAATSARRSADDLDKRVAMMKGALDPHG